MVSEDYCSFELSKLLKEKGFDWMCNSYYTNLGRVFDHFCCHYFADDEHDRVDILTQTLRPTRQMAMKWLREEHKIYADPIQQGNYDDNSIYYTYSVAQIIDGRSYIHRPMSVVDKLSYEEAVEAALKYCLTELI